MKSEIFFSALNRLVFLALAHLFIQHKLSLISLANVNENKKHPNASETAATVKQPMHQNTMCSKENAIVYPIGLFVSNGKLSKFKQKENIAINF